MSLRVYVAAPLGERPRAWAAAQALRAQGFVIVSSWHDLHLDRDADPEDADERAYTAKACTREITRAQALLALTNQGTPRGTYVEIGMALAMAIPVFWLVPRETHDPRSCVFDAHPYVTRGHGFGELEAALVRYARVDPEVPPPPSSGK